LISKPQQPQQKTITNAATIITGVLFPPSCYAHHFFLLLKQMLPQGQPCGGISQYYCKKHTTAKIMAKQRYHQSQKA